MSEPRTTHFIIAKTVRDAENSASIEWGWELTRDRGRLGAIAPDGNFAMFVTSAEALRGIPPDRTIFLAWRCWDVRGLGDLLDYHEARGGRVVPRNRVL